MTLISYLIQCPCLSLLFYPEATVLYLGSDTICHNPIYVNIQVKKKKLFYTQLIKCHLPLCAQINLPLHNVLFYNPSINIWLHWLLNGAMLKWRINQATWHDQCHLSHTFIRKIYLSIVRTILVRLLGISLDTLLVKVRGDSCDSNCSEATRRYLGILLQRTLQIHSWRSTVILYLSCFKGAHLGFGVSVWAQSALLPWSAESGSHCFWSAIIVYNEFS